jgi:hypothetical protein
MNQIQEVKNNSIDLFFTHIYREFNTQADHLLKEALVLQDGSFSEQAFRGGTLLLATETTLY